MNSRRPCDAHFWARVDRGAGPSFCWPWSGHRKHDGYGRTWWGGRMWLAHRVAWELERGPIPPGMCVLHRCDNPPCCNPEHLWLGTNADNMADRDAKGRGARGDRNGVRLHPEIHIASRPRGERNGSAKLTGSQVGEIRAWVGRGFTRAAVAKEYGVSRTTVSQIVSGLLWRAVPGLREEMSK